MGQAAIKATAVYGENTGIQERPCHAKLPLMDDNGKSENVHCS